MRVWAKLIRISKLILIVLAVFFLTSCSGIIPNTHLNNQNNNPLNSLLPGNDDKAKSASIYLDVPFQKYGGVNWCLPASAAMTLNFFGLQISQQELAGSIIKPDGLGDITKMVKFAKDLGFNASFTVLTMEEIEEFLSKQIPLIAIQKYKQTNPLAHARVLIGYDAEKKEVCTNDPTLGEHYTVSYEQFKNLNLTANPKYCMTILITPAYL